MKKFVQKLFLTTALVSLAACGGPQGGNTGPADDVKPVIEGVQTKLTCVAGQDFNLLTGITATDNVDGDITSNITVSTFPDMTVTAGVISPDLDDVGTYDVTYTVSDNAGNKAEEFSILEITKPLAPKTLYRDYNFDEDLQGWTPDIVSPVVGTKGIVRGKYVFDITESDGTDWHVKYAYYSYPVEAGHTYDVEVTFSSTVAGEVMILGQSKTIRVGNNTIKNSFDTKVSGNKHIEIQFGKLPAPFKVEMEKITITDNVGVIDDTQTEAYGVPTGGTLTDGWKFNSEGYVEYSHGNASENPDECEGTLVTTENDATVTVTKAAAESWRGKFLLQTKANITRNVQYHVTVTLESNVDLSGLEYGYGGWGDDFKTLKAEYNYSLTANTPTEIKFDVKHRSNFTNPMFCLKMGNAPVGATVKASAFSVTYETGNSPIDFENEDMFKAWSETASHNTVKENGRTKTSITTVINGEKESPYMSSTDVVIKGINLAAAKTYRLSFKLASTKKVEQVKIMGGSNINDWDPTSLFETDETVILNADETRTFEAIIKSTNATNFKMRIKYGSAENGTEITLSDLKFEIVKFVESTATSVLPETFAFNGRNVSRVDGDNRPTVAATATEAVFTSTAQDAANSWKAKASVHPGMALSAGVRYRFAIDVTVSADVTGFEVGVGLSGSDDFKKVDHMYGVNLSANQKRTFEFVKVLEENLSNAWGFGVFMGTAPVGATVTVNNIVVEESPAATTATDKTYEFIPVGVGQSAVYEQGGARSELYVENGVLIYDILTLSHTIDWANKFFLKNVYLEGGAQYIFELEVKCSVALNGDLILNKEGAWDPRVTAPFELTTEYQTITLETSFMNAPLMAELLFQDMHQNVSVDAATIYFKSIKIYSRAAE